MIGAPSQRRSSCARDRGETGFALVTAVILMAIMAMLAALAVQNGTHSERTSERGKSWTTAVHVAESGVHQAIALLQGANGGAVAPFVGAVADGTYSVNVTALGRNRYQVDSTGTSGRGAGLAATRALRVTMAPPRSFSYALFSLTDVNTKNNDTVVGDIWANGSVVVDENDLVDGSITAATGRVFLDNNSSVLGDVQSGGYEPSTGVAIDVSTGASIDGNAKASSTAPGCSDDPGHVSYSVNVIGSIGGSATTWGSKTGTGTVGSVHPGVCTDAPATKPMPPFTWNPASYASPQTFASPTAFNAYLDSGTRTNLAGTFYVQGGGASEEIDLTGVEISGDTVIIAASAPIDANGVGAANSADKILVLVSYYEPPSGSACTTTGGNPADCAIGMKNNFQPTDNTATLIYAPNGPVAFKNNAEFDGAVYANDIVLKNNQVVVYDERVAQVVGFGPVTLEPESWMELPA